jgi:transketolase
VATRLAYGEALVAVGDARDDVVVLDAETGNSTHAELFAKAHPDRFFEMFIAEQQMLGAAVGLAARGWTPFASTFAAFTTRAFEFVRMAAIGGTAVRLCGSHSGLSVGESGASGMALEDVACFRTIAGSVVLQPCDGNQAAALVATAADVDEFVYLRTSRNPVPVIYEPGEAFPVGGSRVLASSSDDVATVVASGIVVHAALEARGLLSDEGIALRVVDAYSIKPIDAETLLRAADETDLVVAVEDHYAEGGLGSAVAEVLAEAGSGTRLVRHAVREIQTSGKVAALYKAAGLDGEGIGAVVRTALRDRSPEPVGGPSRTG